MNPGYLDYLKSISLDPQIADNHQYASVCLKKLIQLKYLNYQDIIENPEKFFDAHSQISHHNYLEGFSIKFTVQFNLFAGSIMNLGTPKQKNWLIDSQNEGDLGCFMLTEYQAGVSSGLIVMTRADIVGDHIVINTPDIIYDAHGEINFDLTAHRKNWISQGLSARYGVVIAQLYDADRRLGIYPFLIDMEDPNIHKKDNGLKTGINGLDNAQIIFKNLRINLDQIMFDDLDWLREAAKHNPSFNPNTGFTRVATRLNSGRLCIADSLLSFVTNVVKKTIDGPLSKQIYLNPKIQIKLNELPEIRDMLTLIDHRLSIMRIFIDNVKREYCLEIKARRFNIHPDLIEKIMVAKILAIDYGLDVVQFLRHKIGSNSLFAKNYLGSNLDILFCGRFAEGDNDILVTKLVFDRLKKLTKDGMMTNFLRLNVLPLNNSIHTERYKLLQLASILSRSSNVFVAFTENYQLVKSCAEFICYNVVRDNLSNQHQQHLHLTDIKAML